MAENSKIEWCRHTFNPWVGCTALSPACDFCYAEGWAKRTGQAALWQGERRRTAEANWRLPLKWNAAAATESERPRVFCASLADVFDNQVPTEWRDDLWDLIAGTRNLDWMLLTKRPENIPKMFPVMDSALPGYKPWNERWPWMNVWLGTTVEDRTRLRRIDVLRRVPARIRFLSIEPLLEDLGEIDLTGIHLVIVGGESGPKARPLSLQWVRSIREQCAAAGVAFFFKQWGEWAPANVYPSGTPGRFAFGDYKHDPDRMIRTDHYPRQYTMFGARSVMERVGKARAGRLLDGRAHDAMPERVA